MIKVITNNKDAYRDAIKYIKSNFAEDLHFQAAFEGTIFDRTAKMLQFDLYGLENVVGISEDSVERIVFYEDEVVVGIAICVLFREFMYVLDYEKYMIIAAESKDVFNNLLAMTNTEDVVRLELITFRDCERQYIEKYKHTSYIHYWDMYEIEPCKLKNTIEYAKFQLRDIERVEENCKNENNPIRYKIFQDSNMEGYSVWTLLDDKGSPVLAGSVVPYVGRVAEIKLFEINDELCYPEKTADFVRCIVGECSCIYDRAVFRVKRYSKLINKMLEIGNFKCISKEQHIHIWEV